MPRVPDFEIPNILLIVIGAVSGLNALYLVFRHEDWPAAVVAAGAATVLLAVASSNRRDSEGQR